MSVYIEALPLHSSEAGRYLNVEGQLEADLCLTGAVEPTELGHFPKAENYVQEIIFWLIHIGWLIFILVL